MLINLSTRKSTFSLSDSGLVFYYEELAKHEAHSASEVVKVGGHLPVPLREGNQFLCEGGWQSILQHQRDQTRAIAQHHATFADSITSNVVSALRRTKSDIKLFIEELVAEPSRLATEVGKQRAESTRLISQLALGIVDSKRSPNTLTSSEDPVILRRHVEKQLKAQLAHENALTLSVISYQKKSSDLEKRVNVDIQGATKEFEKARLHTQEAISREWKKTHDGVTALEPTLEWNEFAKRSQHLLPEDAVMRDPDKIVFPGQDDPATKPVKSGLLERKKRFTMHYKESIYVLTPSGYLHEYKVSDSNTDGEPELSIFLPYCALGPISDESSKDFKWHVEGNKKTSGGHHTGSLNKVRDTLRVGKKEVAYSFKARSHGEMVEWWNAMQQSAKVSLGAQESATVTAVMKLGLDSDISHSDYQNKASAEHKSLHSVGDESSEEEEHFPSAAEISTAPSTPAATDTPTVGLEPRKQHDNAEGLPVYKHAENGQVQAVDLNIKPVMHDALGTAHVGID